MRRLDKLNWKIYNRCYINLFKTCNKKRNRHFLCRSLKISEWLFKWISGFMYSPPSRNCFLYLGSIVSREVLFFWNLYYSFQNHGALLFKMFINVRFRNRKIFKLSVKCANICSSVDTRLLSMKLTKDSSFSLHEYWFFFFCSLFTCSGLSLSAVSFAVSYPGFQGRHGYAIFRAYSVVANAIKTNISE